MMTGRQFRMLKHRDGKMGTMEKQGKYRGVCEKRLKQVNSGRMFALLFTNLLLSQTTIVKLHSSLELWFQTLLVIKSPGVLEYLKILVSFFLRAMVSVVYFENLQVLKFFFFLWWR